MLPPAEHGGGHNGAEANREEKVPMKGYSNSGQLTSRVGRREMTQWNGCREVSHFGLKYKMELGRATCHQRRLQQPNKSRIMRCLRSACLLRVGQSPGSSPMCAVWIPKHSLKNTAWTTAQPRRTCLKEQTDDTEEVAGMAKPLLSRHIRARAVARLGQSDHKASFQE